MLELWGIWSIPSLPFLSRGQIEFFWHLSCENKLHDKPFKPSANCDAKGLLLSQNGVLFCTCEDGAGWHLIPYRISPRSEFFSQAYKTWHITWGINLGPDWPPLARGSKFHTIHTPTRSLSSSPRQQKIWTYRF